MRKLNLTKNYDLRVEQVKIFNDAGDFVDKWAVILWNINLAYGNCGIIKSFDTEEEAAELLGKIKAVLEIL